MSFTSEVIRMKFKEGDDIRDAGLKTPDDIIRCDDIVYGSDPKWQVLDIYRPREAGKKILPVIVSVHGGGWIYGDKERYQFYCMNLAQRGFAVVNFTYRLSPEYKYPAALEDTNLVMKWIMDHAEQYGLDTAHVFAVGDSAGAHNLGLYAGICTNPEYAKEYDFKVPENFKLRAIALNCGSYHIGAGGGPDDLTAKLMGDYLPEGGSEKELELICVERHITENYVPICFMTCTGDFLQEQAPILQKKLLECRVPHVFQFYGNAWHELGHVFCLNIKLDIANKCNQAQCDFFKSFLD